MFETQKTKIYLLKIDNQIESRKYDKELKVYFAYLFAWQK